MLPCTTTAFTSTGKPDDLSSLRDDLRSRFASGRSRYRGLGSRCVVPARRAVSAFYAVFVHRLAGLIPPRSVHEVWLRSFTEPLSRPRHSPSLPSHGRSPFRSWLQMVVFYILMFWFSHRGLAPHLHHAHAGHPQGVGCNRRQTCNLNLSFPPPVRPL